MASSLESRIDRLSKSLFEDLADQKIFENSIKEKKSAKPIHICFDGESLIESKEIPSLWLEHLKINESISENHSYQMDCSSIFMIAPLMEINNNLFDLKVCDLCAAPGGKSILASQILKPKILISNERTRERVKSLISNFSKYALKNSAITSLEIKQLSFLFPNYFDVLILDAPCSGQSLIARGIDNPSSLTRISIDRSSNTQKGLINQAAKLLSNNGYILYSTCTYSKDENEKVIEWFLKKHPSFETIEIKHLVDYRSKYTNNFCYRLWPYQKLGAGGFCCLLKNNSGDDYNINEVDLNKNYLWSSLEK